MTIDARLTRTSPPVLRAESLARSTSPTQARTRADDALSPRFHQGHTSRLPPRTAAPSTATMPHPLHDASPRRRRSGDLRFHELLGEVNLHRQTSSTEGIDLGSLLAARHHPSTIKGVKLSGDATSLTGLRLCGLHFDDCEFDWSHFSGTCLINCQFENCDFKNASLMNAILRGGTFRQCNLHEVMLLNAELRGVGFTDCLISRSSFEDARIVGCSFSRTAMPATHFLGASISGSRMEDCNLTDAAFFGTESAFDMDLASKKTARMTRPTTATLVFPEQRGDSVPRVGGKIANVAKTIPLRIAMQAPATSGDEVDREVSRFLERRPPGAASPRSLAQQLVIGILENPEDFPSSALILEKAKVLTRHVDSVVLPGGEDVSPHLYGGTPEPETTWKGDYRRSLLELGLIHQCVNKGVPLMAICRGFQMTSIYFGAQLRQHVGLQAGVRVLGENRHAGAPLGLFGNALDTIRTAVYHHQAVPAGFAMAPLQPALTQTLDSTPDPHCEAVMAVESSTQMAPLMGVQFHPEFLEADSAWATPASITNEDLRSLASRYVDPGTGASGIRNPAQMIASGILGHMSPGNDVLWKILAEAAQSHHHKAQIGADVLTGGNATLKPLREASR